MATPCRYLQLRIRLPFVPAALLLTSFVVTHPVAAQDNPDSLIKALPAVSVDTQRIALLCDISEALGNTDPGKGLQYGKQALAEAERVHWNTGIQLAGIRIGKHYRRMSQNDSARIYYYTALSAAEASGNKLGLANCHNVIGIYYRGMGNYPEALQHQLKALALFEDIGKKEGAAMCLGNIGIIYDDEHDLAKANEYYNKALQQYRALGDKNYIAINLSNLANLYEEMGQHGRALSAVQDALQAAEALGSNNLILNNLINAGIIHTSFRQYDSALQYFQRALALARGVGDKGTEALCLGYVGESYSQAAADSTGSGLKQLGIDRRAALRAAAGRLTEAIAMLRSQENPDKLAEFYASRSEAFRQMGRSDEALTDFREAVRYRDSVFSMESRTRIANLETGRALALADKQIEIDRLAVAKKRSERVFFIGGLALLTIVIFFVARERKKSEKLLLNILPPKIAERLKKREHPIADAFAEVSIMFIDMANFTPFTLANDPRLTVDTLNDIFTRFDALAGKHGLEKIKTIGDCYMAVAGLPQLQADHALRAAAMAIDVREAMKGYRLPGHQSISFRIGIDCGPVVAGVIGRRKFTYDLWGHAVNIASRMESSGVPGEIHCSDNFRKAVGSGYTFTSKGIMDVKGIGMMETWIMTGG